jgi:SAM-dependent methyltransferase
MTTFKDHFSGHAASYRDARPRYPRALYDWLAAQCARHALAWDAGCGNGQAAIELGERFDAVLATDPSAPQVANAVAHPRVTYRVEPAEQCSAGDASVDLVTVAQALHWFDFARFFAEVDRVLVPGGVFAAWSYGLMDVHPAFDAVVRELYEPVLGPYWPPERAHVEARYETIPIPFDALAAPAFAMRARWTVDDAIAYLETWSALQRCRKATGRDPLADMDARLRAAWGHEAQREVVWPLVVKVSRKLGYSAP